MNEEQRQVELQRKADAFDAIKDLYMSGGDYNGQEDGAEKFQFDFVIGTQAVLLQYLKDTKEQA